jgi:hypothetical protein
MVPLTRGAAPQLFCLRPMLSGPVVVKFGGQPNHHRRAKRSDNALCTPDMLGKAIERIVT